MNKKVVAQLYQVGEILLVLLVAVILLLLYSCELEETWKTVTKSSGDEAEWILSVTDVSEIDSQTYEVVCKPGMDELDFENGKLYATSSPTDPATKKVFECVPAEE